MHKAIDRDPSHRYQTAGELAAELQRYLEDEPIRAKWVSPMTRFRRWCKRNPAVAALSTTVVLLLAVGVAAVSASMGWAARDRAARQVILESHVEQALEAVEQSYDDHDLTTALAKVQQAQGLLEAADAQNGPLLDRARQWQSDLATATRLDSVGLEKQLVSGGPNHEQVDSDYRDVFDDYGLTMDEQALPATADRIRNSHIRDRLLAGLHDWIMTKQQGELKGIDHLLRVADRADTNRWRSQLRAAVAQDDLELLIELARSENLLRQPSSAIVLLATALRPHDRALAVETLQRAQRAHPDDFWFNWYLARFLPDKTSPSNRYPREAIGHARAALALRPDSSKAHGLVASLIMPFDWTESKFRYREAIRLDPANYWAHANFAGALIQHGEYDEAETYVRKAIELESIKEPHSRWLLRNALCLQGRCDEGDQVMRELFSDPDELKRTWKNWQQWSLQGVIGNMLSPPHVGWRNVELAFELAQQAVEVSPEWGGYWMCLGDAQRIRGNRDAAVTAYQQWGEIAGIKRADQWEFWNDYGVRWTQVGQWDEALTSFDRAIDLAPEDPRLRRNRAACLVNQSRWRDAANELAELVTLGGNDWRSDYELALCRLALGEQDSYREICQRLLKTDPASVDAQAAAFLAWTCALAPAATDDYLPAMTLAWRGLEQDSDNTQYRTHLGAVLYRSGRYDEALKTLTATGSEAVPPEADNLTSPAYSWYFVALTHQALGNREAAKSWLAQADQWTAMELGDREYPPAWNRRLTLELLRAEATAQIGEPPTVTTSVAETDAVWVAAAERFARTARWHKSAYSYQRSEIKFGESAQVLAKLLVLAGDTDGYRRHCQAMRDQALPIEPGAEAIALSDICCSGPDPGIAADEILRWLQQARQQLPDNRWVVSLLPIAHYRAGQYEQARNAMPAADSPSFEHAVHPFIAACIEFQLNHLDESRDWFNKGVSQYQPAAAKARNKYVTWSLQHWLNASLGYREAAILLQDDPLDMLKDKHAAQQSEPGAHQSEEQP